ncbi:MAG: hypothetical protein AAF913_18775, partial [Pseudomonadota bacterium]
MDHRILALLCVALLPATAAANGLCTTYPGFPAGSAAADGMVRIEAGSFLMGSEARPYRPEEGPVRQVDVA